MLKLAGLFLGHIMSNKIPYTKSHKTHAEQVDILKKRGMIVDDPEWAESVLQHINYYRLGIYWHFFEKDHETHQFRDGTSFAHVVELYDFDRKLRLLVFDALERIEVSVRTQWAYHLSKAHGAHAHLNREIHNDKWEEAVEYMDKSLANTGERFIKRSMEKYEEETPPIWAVSEILSFGSISRWIKNIKDNKVRKAIAVTYGVRPDILESWLQHLSVLRNRCAHHARLWNRDFSSSRIKFPRNQELLGLDPQTKAHKLFHSLTIILYLLDIISPDHSWRKKFVALLDAHPSVPRAEMGFLAGWRDNTVWHK